MKLLLFPKIELGDTPPASLEATEELAVRQFMEAYSFYAKRLGSNNLSAVAVEIDVGAPSQAEPYAVMIGLFRLEQTLMVSVVMSEASLAEIECWLNEQYDESLDIRHESEVESEFSFGFDGFRVVEPSPLSFGENEPYPENAIELRPSPLFAALTLVSETYRHLDDHLALTNYTMSVYALPSKEPCSDCGKPLVRVGCVTDLEGNFGEEEARLFVQGTMHEKDFDQFCQLLTWFCDGSDEASFISLNHTCKTGRAFKKAVAQLHEREMAEMGAFLAVLGDVAQHMAEQEGSEDHGGASGKPTMH